MWTRDPGRAAEFYGHVLGWRYDPATRQVTNTAQPIGIFGVDADPTLFCCFAVTDLQSAGQAILDGRGAPGEVRQFDFGAVLDATDAAGTPFAVYQPAGAVGRPALNDGGPGELSYITFEVRDSAAFRDCYGRLLGWSFQPGRIDDGWRVTPAHPMSGVAGGNDRDVTVPMWTVADVDAAVSRVRVAGGTVIDEPSRQPYGTTAQCRDDQGGGFDLGEF